MKIVKLNNQTFQLGDKCISYDSLKHFAPYSFATAAYLYCNGIPQEIVLLGFQDACENKHVSPMIVLSCIKKRIDCSNTSYKFWYDVIENCIILIRNWIVAEYETNDDTFYTLESLLELHDSAIEIYNGMYKT